VSAVSARASSARREKVVIVTRKTMLEELTVRFNTPGQARFYLEHAGQDFSPSRLRTPVITPCSTACARSFRRA